MEDEEIRPYESDVVYRPPLEANSVLLEVTYGCSWRRCTFCRRTGDEFRINSLEVIEEKLRLLAAMKENQARTDLFFLGANSFHLAFERLKAVFELVHRHLPNIRRISMYSRCDDVWPKSDGELLQLKSMGLGDLYIGLESGADSILRRCRKGLDSAQMLETFRRLERLGINYSLSSILGLGGREHSREHALETAAQYNRTHPRTIRIMTLTPWPDTSIYDEIQAGRFEELSPWEILQEERLFLSALDLQVENCIFVGTHVSNNIPLAGLLPRHKRMLLEILDEVIAVTDPAKVTRQKFEHM